MYENPKKRKKKVGCESNKERFPFLTSQKFN